ncbi:hypothetical protein Fcan01_24984 [Folsomia candida]|uniref:Uncharacterized protein n=1 Tax=Folsomia candida TaxID=158441 RepID=A0A226D7T9_FOLCA|nr:hypothetical protein Fcan01_24984 [Folsomia candida]
MENWKLVLVGYSGFLHGISMVSLLHVERMREEIVIMQNSCMETELKLIREGINCVRRYFVTLGALSVSSIVSVPLAVSLISSVAPCMPPLLSSMMILDCKDWGDDDSSGVLVKVGIGIMEFYAWTVITGTICYGLYIPLLYPVEIKFLILDIIKNKFWKKETCARNHGNRHLHLYRILNLLTIYRNNAWCLPSMPVVIGGVIAADTVSLYILVTSYDQVPLLILILFSIICLDCMIIIHVVFNILSKPYTTSCDFIEFMKSRNGTKWVKRFMRSCQPSKLTMGDGTFFDRLTSFVIWQKGIDYLITLLLM